MPKLTEDELFAFLDEREHLVRIGTVDADGMPRVVPLWFIRQGDDICFTPRTPALVHINLARDPRVALSIDEDPLPYRKVTVQGHARLLHGPGEDDVWRDLYRAIAQRYITVEAAEGYVQGTIDQPRALYAVSLRDASTKLSTWRMPVEGEDGTGIWARRYYGDGTIMARMADGGGE
jgi:nitroimidazol reductase NimA-like FMN-containing flavoprotein (pyridoxamine 5'-phosphate oxidase superfamily)